MYMGINERCALDAQSTRLLHFSPCTSYNAGGCGSPAPLKFSLVGPAPLVFTLQLVWESGRDTTSESIAQTMCNVNEVSAC